MDIELHFERIMGLYFDYKRQLLHSVAKDRRYRVVDLKTSALRAGNVKNINVKLDFEPSSFELTGMVSSEER